jgi:hypothetical protein
MMNDDRHSSSFMVCSIIFLLIVDDMRKGRLALKSGIFIYDCINRFVVRQFRSFPSGRFQNQQTTRKLVVVANVVCDGRSCRNVVRAVQVKVRDQ